MERSRFGLETGNWHACAEKYAYQTIGEARRACREVADREGKPMGCYRCPVCHCYHMTHRTDPGEVGRHPGWTPLLFVVGPRSERDEEADRERIRWWCERHEGVTASDMAEWTGLTEDEVLRLAPAWFRGRSDLI